jgi:hypothetical protein
VKLRELLALAPNSEDIPNFSLPTATGQASFDMELSPDSLEVGVEESGYSSHLSLLKHLIRPYISLSLRRKAVEVVEVGMWFEVFHSVCQLSSRFRLCVLLAEVVHVL